MMRNEVILKGIVTQVVLNSGIALIDTEDLGRLEDFGRTWKLSSQGYAFTNEKKEVGYTSLMLHRFILNPVADLPLIDHINGKPLDNRKVNLRRVTMSENCFNRVNSFVNINDNRINFLHEYAEAHEIDLTAELNNHEMLYKGMFYIRDARALFTKLA